ncbi:P2X purinoceptor 6 isoform X2 [Colius striatus]|uniref:P2X purinoceptor 6 isoform X2 n=1 Tax=Colius striatus TaxID=57412 RepID=UPI002B1CF457|nr:P2X purinoceptor 6 isoform X2 [Colius striatus]
MSRWVWKPPKNEPPHPPWAAWTRAPSPQHQRSFSLSGTFCVPAFVHYPLSCHWTPQKNILVNINEILLQSPLLQTKQPRVPQPFLIRKMLQSPGHLGSPALASLQQFPVPLELGSPELDTGLQMRPQQGRAEGEQNLLPTLSEGKQQVSQQAWRQSPSILDAMCTEDADCPMGNPVVHGNGIKTGKCVKFNTSHSTCEIYGWCPVENNTLPRKPLLAEAANFTLFIKNTVHFTKFNFSKCNTLQTNDSTYFKSCTYDPHFNPSCPVFRVRDMVEAAGETFEDLALLGGSIGVRIDWDCNLDHPAAQCQPQYSFSLQDRRYNFRGCTLELCSAWSCARHHLPEGRDAAAQTCADPEAVEEGRVLPGILLGARDPAATLLLVPAQTASYYRDPRQGLYRNLLKLYGIRFDISVHGQAGKFSIVPAAVSFGTGIAFFGAATVVCDLVLLYLDAKADFYWKEKFEEAKPPKGKSEAAA